MSGPGAIFWRLLPGVRPRERGRFLIFAAVSALLGVAQTLGLIGSESLFLARLGVDLLPHFFVLAAGVAVAAMLGYAASVGRLRNDSFFIWLLIGASAALHGGHFLVRSEWIWAPGALLCAYFVTVAVFTNHFWTFTVDYFDTPTLQRLAPLFTVGMSLGSFGGGLLAVGLNRLAPADALIVAWALCFLVGAALLRGARQSLRRWGPLGLEEADEASVEGIRGARRYIRRSGLGKWLLLSTIGLVLSLFVIQYLYSRILLEAYPGAEALAGFLAVYLTTTNALEVAVGLGLTPLLIRRLGVARANLIHPALLLGAFGLLAFDFRLIPALIARLSRELIYNSVAEPLRHLVYNALPFRFRGRIRAYLEGIVLYAGMGGAGLLLLLVPVEVEPLWLCLGGAGLALLYLLANLAVRREYLRAVVGAVREGSLDLSAIQRDISAWEVSRIAELWSAMMRDTASQPAASDLELAPVLAAHGLIEPLIESAGHRDARVRCACVLALHGSAASAARRVIERALDDPDSSVRLAALAGARAGDGSDPGMWHDLLRARLDDADAEVRAGAALALGAEGLEVLEQMVRSADETLVSAAFRRIPVGLLWLALERSDDPRGAIRAAALEAVTRLVQPVPIDPARLLADLQDPDSAVRSAALRALATLGAEESLASALADPSASVRGIAVEALGARGDAAIDAVLPQLAARSLPTVESALRALGAIGSKRARRELAADLTRRVESEWRARQALAVLEGRNDPALRFLRLAYEDLAQRSRRLSFLILQLTEDARLIRAVQRTLHVAAARARGDALEVISNLADRRIARLFVLLLEDGPIEEKIPVARADLELPVDLKSVLEASHKTQDHWVQRGLNAYEAALQGVRDGTRQREDDMDRLLLIRSVPLFSQLTLDQLEAINALLSESPYVEGEVVCREGDIGDRLFVLADGEVEIFRNYGSSQQLRLGGQSPVSAFGEMAVLDNSPRSATVVASRDSRLLTLQGARLKELVLQMPEIAFDFFRVLTARVRAADQRFEDATRS